MKGLLNHIGPMLQRLESGEQLDNSTDSFIPESYDYVYQNLDKILKRDRSLSELTENEAVYLAIFFIGSLETHEVKQYRTLLLICGYGYGTTAVSQGRADQRISGTGLQMHPRIQGRKL